VPMHRGQWGPQLPEMPRTPYLLPFRAPTLTLPLKDRSSLSTTLLTKMVRVGSDRRMVISSKPDWSEILSNLPHHLCLLVTRRSWRRRHGTRTKFRFKIQVFTSKCGPSVVPRRRAHARSFSSSRYHEVNKKEVSRLLVKRYTGGSEST